MSLFGEYLLFLAKAATIIVVLILLFRSLPAFARTRRGEPGQLRVRHLNRRYRQMAETIEAATLPRSELRKLLRLRRREPSKNLRVFVMSFDGDIQASSVRTLREEITAVIAAKRPGDEVVLRLESVGGLVAAYGLAASQLARLRQQEIRLTVCIDRVAASGGYLMAAVADRIVAAPFAVVGSIGVIAQLPNFHNLLKKHDIEWERFQAGQYKRTVTLFGENTEEGRAKVREQVEEAHALLKEFVARYRPHLDVERVATGEYWYGRQAVEQGLVDALSTSDEHLLGASRQAEIYELSHVQPGRWRPQCFP